ncbi:MAG: ABC transporter permease [Candidatus Rokuibacteriota bacterium]|nr:MAG: ABC transporter permease [Candidatus Rokubacteria bacterium]
MASDRSGQWRHAAEALVIPIAALAAAMAVFGVFMAGLGQNPLEIYALIYKGAFANAFSWQNTLSRAAPLILTALCVALPAQAGLMVIGGEGAVVLGGLTAAIVGHLLSVAAPAGVKVSMMLVGMLVGGLWIALAGALRQYRGVNETISSLLLTYVAVALFNHFVEGPLRDPSSLNKPSTASIGDVNMIGNLPGLDIHWGLGLGIVFCIAMHVLVHYTTYGFALRIVGGNPRAARLAGLPVGALVLTACVLGGAAAGLAGAVEVAAVHGSANASLIAGYGYAGIVVAFIARQNPLAIVPVAVLVGGLSASGGMLQRRLDLPDATVLVLQGIAFMLILGSEALYGRLKPFRARAA